MAAKVYCKKGYNGKDGYVEFKKDGSYVASLYTADIAVSGNALIGIENTASLNLVEGETTLYCER